jgi:Domain of unknown function (DUF4359)
MRINWQIVGWIGGLGGAIGLSMALTNPSPQQYEEFVLEKLQAYMQDECGKAGNQLLGVLANATCRMMASAGEPYFKQTIQPLIAKNSHRQNFGIFSLYTTDLAVSQLSFSARVECVGVFDRFLVYRIP